MPAAKAPARRCAIYTRKSSEEGLDQDFNSLHAQREACEAYIKSQAGEGWKTIPASYDDGGYSGGTMQRPSLDRLLDDVKAGRIDTVVVYKVDRLTRSLADFAKIVEIFDRHDVAFVSVTQQFNTTTSMGRLTLNMLLSFAQFEREVTGERIRDKIAASKRKGMWMGGFVPLGYEPDGRTLTVNQAEAETVRTVFRLYLQLGNVRLVKAEADRLGLRTKVRTRANGRAHGGCRVSRGYIYKLLGNPIYVGRIRHGAQTFEGLHEAIVDAETWDAVQAKLAQHSVKQSIGGCRTTSPSPLMGKLFDASGRKLTPSHAKKQGRRYRYYVSRHLIAGSDEGGDAGQSDGWRLPAAEIEGIISTVISDLMGDQAALTDAAREAGVAPRRVPGLLNAAKSWNGGPLALVDKVTLGDGLIEVALDLSSITGAADIQLHLKLPVRIKRRGVELRLVLRGPSSADHARHDPTLIKAVARAVGWFDDLASGRVASVGEIAASHQVGRRYVAQQLRLAFLAPDIVTSILAGTQPADLTAEALIRHTDLPVDWDEQRALLGVR